MLRRLSAVYRKLDVYLRSIYELFGSLDIIIPRWCRFCQEENKDQAPFLVAGTDGEGNSVCLPCCHTHKREIESESDWIINNLRLVHGLDKWIIRTPEL